MLGVLPITIRRDSGICQIECAAVDAAFRVHQRPL